MKFQIVMDWLAPFFALALVVGAFSLLPTTEGQPVRDFFLTGDNARFIAAQGIVIALGTLGMALVLLSGGIDLSAGASAALAGVVAATLLATGHSVSTALLAALLSGGLIGWLNGTLITALGIAPFIVTLGMIGVARGAASWIGGAVPIPLSGEWWIYDWTAPFPALAWLKVAPGVWVVLFLAGVLTLVLRGTVFGRHLCAIGSNEAAATLYASLLTNPRQPDVVHHWVYLRQKMCDWPIFDGRVPGMPPEALAAETGPLSMLALFDDIAFQAGHVKTWMEKKGFPASPRLAPEEGYAHERIRLGYLSSDYCEHPVSYLMTELIERHDRSRFEVYGYCATPQANWAGHTRPRIVGAFDTCRFIQPMSDEQAARLIREDEIDILIDLNGLTMGTRMFILRARPAPVQLTYLGYIGPIPMPELDYMICDDFVIPPELAAAYQPQPLYLPEI